MSESSGDTPENSSAPAPAQPSPSNLPTASRLPRAKPPVVVVPNDAPPGLHEFLAVLVKAFSGTSEQAPSQAAQPKKQKFQRRQTFGSELGEVAEESPAPKTDRPTGIDRDDASGKTSESPATGTPPPKYTDSAYTAARMRKSKPGGFSKTSLVFAWQLLAVALVAGSFLLGRATVQKTPSKPLADPLATGSSDERKPAISKAETLALVDQAMAAEVKGDFFKGLDLLEKVSDSGAHVAGLDFHRALLAYEADELNQVLPFLNRSIAAGEEVAACYNLRGTMANRRGGVMKGFSELETATQLDPFNANYLYFLGEGQRRAGRPQAAILTLQRATDRQRDENLSELYQLKIRLAQIEAGQEQSFAAALTANLALPQPPLNWLFTAAALEMHRGNFAAAAGYLDKIAARADDGVITNYFRDYYFVGFAREKELARFFDSPAAAAAPPTAPSPAPPVTTPAKP